MKIAPRRNADLLTDLMDAYVRVGTAAAIVSVQALAHADAVAQAIKAGAGRGHKIELFECEVEEER